MRRVTLLILASLILAACGIGNRGDRAGSEELWVLQTLDGRSFPARATISFGSETRVIGDGPCNSFTAAQRATYPWIELANLTATERGCAEFGAEAVYFGALVEMEFIEVQGKSMTMRNSFGRVMVFRAETQV